MSRERGLILQVLNELLCKVPVNKISIVMGLFFENIPLELLLVFDLLYVWYLDVGGLDMIELGVLRNHRAVHRSKYLRKSYQ